MKILKYEIFSAASRKILKYEISWKFSNTTFSRQILEKFSNTKFHENSQIRNFMKILKYEISRKFSNTKFYENFQIRNFVKILKYEISWNPAQCEIELFNADGDRDGQTWQGRKTLLRNFANTSKNWFVEDPDWGKEQQ